MDRFLGLSALNLLNRANGTNGTIWNNVHFIVGRVLLVNFAELHRQDVSPFRLIAVSSVVLVLVVTTLRLFTALSEFAAQNRIELIRAIFAFRVFLLGCMLSLETVAAAYWPIYGQRTALATAPVGVAIALAGPGGPLWPQLAAIILGVALSLAGLFAMKHLLAVGVEAAVRARLLRFVPR